MLDAERGQSSEPKHNKRVANAVAKAVIASTKISQEHRSALYLNQKIDVAAFGPLRERWISLIAKEREWRQRVQTGPGAIRKLQWSVPELDVLAFCEALSGA
jgi:hypothetical protein